MAQWTGTRAFDAAPIAGPAQWLLENADLLPPSGRALDVACGRGRHALLLAAAGYEVTALDHDRTALERVQRQADRLELTVATSEMNLEGDAVDLGEARYDVVLVTRYLHRPLFPALVRSLAPGGVLVYETFLVQQAERGQPKNPAFLLNPGELARLMAPLDVVRSREGEFEGKMVASVAALKT
jgi:SAM-dependent methyltransferase